MKGLIVHPIVWEHLCGILKVSRGFPKFLMEYTNAFIQPIKFHFISRLVIKKVLELMAWI